MDYLSTQGQDITNISPPFSHRMPTVSATQALQDLLSPSRKGISTGLKRLDAALQNRDPQTGNFDILSRGVARGKVTEIYGPPGVGKTALGMQLAVNALSTGQRVIWVDAANSLPGSRLIQLLGRLIPKNDHEIHSLPRATPTVMDLLENLRHITTPTLSHLVALLCHPSATFPPEGTSLIVVDSLSTLISIAYPRTTDSDSTAKKLGATAKRDAQHWASTRKWPVLQYLISALQKLATIHNVAIVITNQTVTKMQSGNAAILVPAITFTAWDTAIAARIMLYRDWARDGKQVRFGAVLKAEGVTMGGQGGVGIVTAFTINDGGLEEIQTAELTNIPNARVLVTPARKRKRDEVMDSDDDLEGSDEDYGWEHEDEEELPRPPPQCQGSEDILIPREDGDEESDVDDGKELG